jgi:hypothetical protein
MEVFRGDQEAMNSQPSPHDISVWRSLVESHEAHVRARMAFCAEGVDRVGLIRRAFAGKDRFTSIYMLELLNEKELEQVFPELVFLAGTAHAALHAVRAAIRSLPRDWLLANLEEAAEPFLRQGTDDEYRRYLELYDELDRDLTARLARRAAAHPDADIREAGQDYLEGLGLKDGHARESAEGKVGSATPASSSSLES